jgi:hypothetical protein
MPTRKCREITIDHPKSYPLYSRTGKIRVGNILVKAGRLHVYALGYVNVWLATP